MLPINVDVRYHVNHAPNNHFTNRADVSIRAPIGLRIYMFTLALMHTQIVSLGIYVCSTPACTRQI